MIKSLAYKVFWAGRYLERIENISRMSLLAIDKGGDISSIPSYLGIDEDVQKYLINNFEILREDVRAFGDEKVMNALSSLEGAIYSSTSDLREYFLAVLKSTLYLGEVIEDQLKPVITTTLPRKQEEIKTQ